MVNDSDGSMNKMYGIKIFSVFSNYIAFVSPRAIIQIVTAIQCLSVYTCGYVIGANLLSFSFSIVSLSSLKSSFVPTRMMGTLGQ